MLPTSSSTDLVGKNARSATALINGSDSSLTGRLAAACGSAAHSLRHGRVARPTLNRCAGARTCVFPGARVVCCARVETEENEELRGHRRGVAATLAIAACGGGQSQAVHEPRGKFPVDVGTASFPLVAEDLPAHPSRDRRAQLRSQDDPRRRGHDLQRHLRLPGPQGRGLERRRVRRQHQRDRRRQSVAADLGRRPGPRPVPLQLPERRRGRGRHRLLQHLGAGQAQARPHGPL